MGFFEWLEICAIEGFWVQMYLVWTGLISKGENDSKFVSFWENFATFGHE